MEASVVGGEGCCGSSVNTPHVEEVEAVQTPPDADFPPKGSSTPPITASITTNSITLDWSPPDHDPETLFQIRMKLTTAVEWTLVYYGKSTSFTMNGLPSGTEVAIHIRAVNEGTFGWSSIALHNTLPTPPEAPTTLTASIVDSNEVVLEWQRPMHDGGYPVTGFRLEMRVQQKAITRRKEASPTQSVPVQKPSSVALTFGNYTRFIAADLEPGVTYCFRVQALNKLGAGDYSEPVVVRKLSRPPNVPEPPVVRDKTFKSVSLSWISPSCNGATIESFTLQLLFLGYGEKCLPHFPACDSATNLNLPGTSEGDHEQGVVYEGSVDSPGLALICDVYCGSSHEFTVKKLRPFSTYGFRVQAQNVAGTSGFSAFATCMTPAAAPHPPAAPTVAEADSSSLTLIWETPELDNGSPVLQYTLEMLKVEIYTRSLEPLDGGKKTGKKKGISPVWVVVYDGPELRSQVSDLAPGNEYSFRVKAWNALGTSSPSSTLVAFTLPAPPCAPLPPTFGRVTPTRVQIKWESPVCDNGMQVTSYKLLLDDGQGGPLQKVYEGDVRSFNASKLVPASTYRAAVQAINACGVSEMSGAAAVALPAELPVASPIAPASPAPVGDDLPRSTTRKASGPDPASLEGVARKKTRPAPAVVALPAELPVASPIAQASPAPVGDDLPRSTTRIASDPDPASLDGVARKKARPAPAVVEAKAKEKGRAVSAPANQPAPPETIKSIEEVKELMRLRRQGWPQRISRALLQISWLVQQLWPLWAILVCVSAGAYIFEI